MDEEIITGGADFVKGVYQTLCQLLTPWWNSPLKHPVPVPREFATSLQQAILGTKQYWEDRYGEMLLKPTESPMETLFRKVLLDQYGRFLNGVLKRLSELEQYLIVNDAQLTIPYGWLRGNKWKLRGYLNYRGAFG